MVLVLPVGAAFANLSRKTADMRAVLKKVLKLLVKHMPMYQLRAAILRWCGYVVGKNAYVGEDLLIIDEPSDRGMVTIGDRVAISPRVTLVVSSRPNFSMTAPYVPVKHGSIVIENDVWLGTGVVVLPNITIGEGAVVGANSLVTKDVRPYTIVGGSPARLIREVSVPWIEEKKNPVP
jgi:maltose O-acetyltransferase